MNPRVKELAEQAGGVVLVGSEIQKFAELIVRECADVVEKNLYQNIGWNTSRAVQRHFGLGPEE
jgi:hypothetical protein